VSDDLRELIRRQYGEGIPVSGQYRTAAAASNPVANLPHATKPAIVWPLTLTLPWSTLISDNKKFRAVQRGDQAIMAINAGYREAAEKIQQLAKSKAAGAQPAAEPLQVTARVWFPDNGVRDMTNWSKLVFDAMKGAIYDDDRWLHDVRWIRMGVDVDQPRAEITITPLL
jgi:Holliday junction resolvase RusA-like endonuclease